MKAIIIAYTSYPNGDAAAVRQHMLAKLLQHNGYTVTVLGFSKQNENLVGSYEDVTYMLYYGNMLYYHKYLSRYLNNLSDIPDLIFLNGGIGPFAFSIGKKFAIIHGIQLCHDCVEWFSLSQSINSKHISIKSFIGYIEKNITNRVLLDKYFSVVSISTYLSDYFKKKDILSFRLPICMDTTYFENFEFKSGSILELTYAGSPANKDYLLEIIKAISAVSESEQKRIKFELFGIDSETLTCLFKHANLSCREGTSIHAMGKVTRDMVLNRLKTTDFTILIRSSTARYAKAGFPTKVVESLMSSTPIICNLTSDLGMYLKDGYDCIEVADETPEAIVKALRRALALTPEQKDQMKKNARKTAEENFDYRLYIEEFGKFIKNES